MNIIKNKDVCFVGCETTNYKFGMPIIRVPYPLDSVYPAKLCNSRVYVSCIKKINKKCKQTTPKNTWQFRLYDATDYLIVSLDWR